MELITGENDKGRRLDRILRKALPNHPLSLLHRLFRQGKILVNGKKAKAQDRLESGAVINIPLPDEARSEKPKRPCTMPSLDIIWDGTGLLAVNKPCGLEIHGENSLDVMVGSFLAGKLPPSLSFKSGPLHRLDKATSGIVVFSTSIEGARLFTSLLRERKVRKTYLALLEGCLEKEEIWQDELVRDIERKITTVVQSPREDSKSAYTKIKPVMENKNYTLAEIEIGTGRTHQIRAQAGAHGHPLCGDRKYGSGSPGGFFLHAWKLEFLEYYIEAPLPAAFRERIRAVFGTVGS
ncbi:MAG: RluA family pseudouridine synthase [Treponema sp.]|jgi:23S rRNA pseudouridine955/2504/2580 synthase|nr:RluA family pseudouridine synthase [Treponema sp.]